MPNPADLILKLTRGVGDVAEAGALFEAIVRAAVEQLRVAATNERDSLHEAQRQSWARGEMAIAKAEREEGRHTRVIGGELGKVNDAEPHPKDCVCGGSGWVYRSELGDDDWDGSPDDTHYHCPHDPGNPMPGWTSEGTIVADRHELDLVISGSVSLFCRLSSAGVTVELLRRVLPDIVDNARAMLAEIGERER